MRAMTGIELRLRRVAADIKGQDIAAAMGVSSARVSRIENSRVVTDEAASKYLAALNTCLTKSTDARSAA